MSAIAGASINYHNSRKLEKSLKSAKDYKTPTAAVQTEDSDLAAVTQDSAVKKSKKRGLLSTHTADHGQGIQTTNTTGIGMPSAGNNQTAGL